MSNTRTGQRVEVQYGGQTELYIVDEYGIEMFQGYLQTCKPQLPVRCAQNCEIAMAIEAFARACNDTRGDTYRVELYNHYTKGCRFPKNGWLVARVLFDGRRANTVRRFGTDEQAARDCASLWNEEPERARAIYGSAA